MHGGEVGDDVGLAVVSQGVDDDLGEGDGLAVVGEEVDSCLK